MEDSDSAIATLEDTISKAPAHGLFHNGRAGGAYEQPIGKGRKTRGNMGIWKDL